MALPVFDLHCDALQRDLDLGQDLGTRTPGHLDLVRGVEGGLEAIVLVCWCDPAWIAEGAAARRTWDLLGAGHRLLARHPELLVPRLLRRQPPSALHAKQPSRLQMKLTVEALSGDVGLAQASAGGCGLTRHGRRHLMLTNEF